MKGQSPTLGPRPHIRAHPAEDDRSPSRRAAVEPRPSPAGSPVVESRVDRGQYQDLIGRLRALVLRDVPADSRVLVVSRGDGSLLRVEGRHLSHFPQNEQGVYAGYHPADSTAAITHLEALRSRGADYLVIPATSFWWLAHYKQFRRHLEHRYPLVVRQDDTCLIYSLAARETAREGTAAADEQHGYQALVVQIREVADAVLPNQATVLVISSGDDALLRLHGRRGWHFPRNEQGVYAGHYPADSEAAIAHLEECRAKGAEYLLIPRTASWWLTYYKEFAEHLARHGQLVVRQKQVCLIYDLTSRPQHRL
jgi:hypothetical protein